MKADSMAKFIAAVEDAEITVWSAVTAPMVHWYNNPDQKQFIKHDGGDYIATARFNRQNEGPGKIELGYANLDDIHEVRTSGTPAQIKQVMEALGMTITDDDMNILIQINASEKDIVPPTGNYQTPSFVYLTQKQFDALTQKEKLKYEEEKHAWEQYLEEKEKKIGSPVQLTLGYPY